MGSLGGHVGCGCVEPVGGLGGGGVVLTDQVTLTCGTKGPISYKVYNRF